MGNKSSKNSLKKSTTNINEHRFNDIIQLHSLFKKNKIFDISKNELRGIDEKYSLTKNLQRYVNPYNIFTIFFIANPTSKPHALIEDFIDALLTTPKEINSKFEEHVKQTNDALNYDTMSNMDDTGINSLDDDITTVTSFKRERLPSYHSDLNLSKKIDEDNQYVNENGDIYGFSEPTTKNEVGRKENFIVYSTKAENGCYRAFFLKHYGLNKLRRDQVEFRPILNNTNMLDFSVVVTPEHPSTNHDKINQNIVASSHITILMFNLSYPSISDTMRSVIANKDLTKDREKTGKILTIIQNDLNKTLTNREIYRKSGEFHQKIAKIDVNFLEPKFDFFINTHPDIRSNDDSEEKAKLFEILGHQYVMNLDIIFSKIGIYLRRLYEFIECKKEIKERVFKRMEKGKLTTVKEYLNLDPPDKKFLRTSLAIDVLENDLSFAEMGEVSAVGPEVFSMLRDFYTPVNLEHNKHYSSNPKNLWKANPMLKMKLQEQVDLILNCMDKFDRLRGKSTIYRNSLTGSGTLQITGGRPYALRRTQSDMAVGNNKNWRKTGKKLMSSIEEHAFSILPTHGIAERTKTLEKMKGGKFDELVEIASERNMKRGQSSKEDVFDRSDTVKYDSKKSN